MKTTTKTLRKRNLKAALHLRRKLRVRKKVEGTAECPRLSVFRSAKHVYAQAIDDVTGLTLAAASTMDKSLRSKAADAKKTEAAILVGDLVARRLKEKGVERVVFDRNGFRYRGRVAGIAKGARDAGLNF